MTNLQRRQVAHAEKNVCVALDGLNDAAAQANKQDPASLERLTRAIWCYSAAEVAREQVA